MLISHMCTHSEGVCTLSLAHFWHVSVSCYDSAMLTLKTGSGLTMYTSLFSFCLHMQNCTALSLQILLSNAFSHSVKRKLHNKVCLQF